MLAILETTISSKFLQQNPTINATFGIGFYGLEKKFWQFFTFQEFILYIYMVHIYGVLLPHFSLLPQGIL